jgi:septum formation protein
MIILASASPRRKVLLDSLNIPYSVLPSNTTEDLSEPIADPTELVRRLSEIKAMAVGEILRASVPDAVIIGSDTVIVLDSTTVLGKPRDAAHAQLTLRRLRNRTHQAITGITILHLSTGAVETSSVSTDVLMRDYSDRKITEYVATGEPLDKAGSYGIQGLGHDLVRSITGCYTNIVGLPLCELTFMLSRTGLPLSFPEVPCSDPSQKPCPRLLH